MNLKRDSKLKRNTIRTVKKEIRILGIDDAPFNKWEKNTFIVGVVFRGGLQIDGILSRIIEVDGFDVSEKIVEMVIESKHYDQLRVIMLNGITFAGFNMADIKYINRETKLPIIVYIEKKPDIKAFVSAMKMLNRFDERINILKNAGKIFSLFVENRAIGKVKVYFQKIGLDSKTAKRIIRMCSINSSMPEPLRIAHMIGYGIKFGGV